MSALVALLVLVAGTMVLTGLHYLRRRPRTEKRLSEYGGAGSAREGMSASLDEFLLLTALRLGRFAIAQGWADPAAVRQKLDAAGNPGNLSPTQFIGIKLLAPLGAVVVAGYLLFMQAIGLDLSFLPFLALISPVIAYFAPGWWLNGKISERQRAIKLALPDMLDLLSVCVQAGMGFDSALRTISHHIVGPLQEEIAHFLNELGMGRPRVDALRDLAERNQLEELQAWVNALIQAEELGSPIADALRHQAEDMRVRREQYARELAARASPTISGVTGCLIAPSAFLLLMVALVMGMFGGEGGGLSGLSVGGP